jgi:hypothetical protein
VSTLAWTSAPWTEEQVAWLTEMQTGGRVHPLTCGRCRDELDVEGVLLPGPDGLHCTTCDDVQTSALLPKVEVPDTEPETFSDMAPGWRL